MALRHTLPECIPPLSITAMILRAILILVGLVGFLEVGAASPCCLERAEESCCGPRGRCPTSPDGSCALAGLARPAVTPQRTVLVAAHPGRCGGQAIPTADLVSGGSLSTSVPARAFPAFLDHCVLLN